MEGGPHSGFGLWIADDDKQLARGDFRYKAAMLTVGTRWGECIEFHMFLRSDDPAKLTFIGSGWEGAEITTIIVGDLPFRIGTAIERKRFERDKTHVAFLVDRNDVAFFAADRADADRKMRKYLESRVAEEKPKER
jgi:hypothetical protein